MDEGRHLHDRCQGDQPAVHAEDHAAWRLRMAEAVAAQCDLDRLGIGAVYLIGSTRNGTAGAGSDIDLLVHLDGRQQSKGLAESYFRGWSQCLAEWNHDRTGQRSLGLLDVHWVTDADIEARTSYACMIGSPTNWARLLRRRV